MQNSMSTSRDALTCAITNSFVTRLCHHLRLDRYAPHHLHHFKSAICEPQTNVKRGDSLLKALAVEQSPDLSKRPVCYKHHGFSTSQPQLTMWPPGQSTCLVTVQSVSADAQSRKHCCFIAFVTIDIRGMKEVQGAHLLDGLFSSADHPVANRLLHSTCKATISDPRGYRLTVDENEVYLCSEISIHSHVACHDAKQHKHSEHLHSSTLLVVYLSSD